MSQSRFRIKMLSGNIVEILGSDTSKMNMPARSEGKASNVNRGLGASLSASEPVAVPPEEARDLDQRAYTNNTTRLQIFSIVVFIPAREPDYAATTTVPLARLTQGSTYPAFFCPAVSPASTSI